MASGDPRDPVFGAPYVGSPVQQASRNNQRTTVLNLYKMKPETITQLTNDNHYTPNGDLYHE